MLPPLEEPLQGFIALVLGLIFGSFANVCIHRLPERRSVVWPGSACPRCREPIAWYDNIPVISWLLLAGHCRRCRAGISWRYPAIEAATGILFLALWAQHGLTLHWVALAWLAASIVILVPIDLEHYILPDAVTLPGIAAGLTASFVAGGIGILRALTGAAVGAGLPLAVRAFYAAMARIRRPAVPEPTGPADPEADLPGDPSREGMGLGDVKMLAMVGAFLGPALVVMTIFTASIIGTLFVLPLLISGRRGMKSAIPFGPFLGAGALVAMLWGESILAWYSGVVIPLPFLG